MRRFLVFTCALDMIASACSTGTTTYAGSPTSPDTGATESRYAGGSSNSLSYGETYIVDKTGKRWDVEAGLRYGLQPARYQFGLGPNAIPPLNNVEMIGPGEFGYPTSNANFMVLGVELNGIARAYPTWTALAHNEVANEVFAGSHVAAAF